jgi:hypothetical protein
VAEEHRLTVIRSFGYVVGQPEQWGDVLSVMRAARRDGIKRFTFEPVSPISLNPSGITFFASTMGAKGDARTPRVYPHSAMFVARAVGPGMPRPCARLEPPYGLYIFRGDPGAADPRADRDRLYCPRSG